MAQTLMDINPNRESLDQCHPAFNQTAANWLNVCLTLSQLFQQLDHIFRFVQVFVLVSPVKTTARFRQETADEQAGDFLKRLQARIDFK